MELRAMRRGRAARLGPEFFLFERAFDDCLERIGIMQRRFERALMIGCPDLLFAKRLSNLVELVSVRDPGVLLSTAVGEIPFVEDHWEPEAQSFDLVLAIGTLDTVNDLPIALRLIRHAMRPGALLIGAMAGGDTLPELRSAMRCADAIRGAAAPHVHPRIDPSAVSPLLESSGFVRPVVDVDRVQVAYRSLARLVGDLRAMGATNILKSRPGPLSRTQFQAASDAFARAGDKGQTKEQFEIIHFAAWAEG